MKKLLLLILFFVLISCSSGSTKESALSQLESKEFILDSVPMISTDSIVAQVFNTPMQDLLAQETIKVKKDTMLKRSNEKRAMNISKLDTTSFTMELKANVEKINYQQKQLDSLLSKKKK